MFDAWAALLAKVDEDDDEDDAFVVDDCDFLNHRPYFPPARGADRGGVVVVVVVVVVAVVVVAGSVLDGTDSAAGAVISSMAVEVVTLVIPDFSTVRRSSFSWSIFGSFQFFFFLIIWFFFFFFFFLSWNSMSVSSSPS